MSRSLAPLLLALLAAGCRDNPAPALTAAPTVLAASQPAAPQRPDQIIGGNVIPQAHDVPAGRAAEVRRIFESGAMSYAVVASSGAQTQFVKPTPVFIGENRFVVGAPPEIHAAIDQMLKTLGNAPATESYTYEIDYWILEAVAAPKNEMPPDVAEIAPMLEKLSGLGQRRYKLVDRISARERDGAGADMTGRIAKVHQKLAAGPDGLDLELELDLKGVWADMKDRGPSLETKLQLKLDQPIVLGDSALPAASDGAANVLLYVVRARRVD